MTILYKKRLKRIRKGGGSSEKIQKRGDWGNKKVVLEDRELTGRGKSFRR